MWEGERKPKEEQRKIFETHLEYMKEKIEKKDRMIIESEKEQIETLASLSKFLESLIDNTARDTGTILKESSEIRLALKELRESIERQLTDITNHVRDNR